MTSSDHQNLQLKEKLFNITILQIEAQHVSKYLENAFGSAAYLGTRNLFLAALALTVNFTFAGTLEAEVCQSTYQHTAAAGNCLKKTKQSIIVITRIENYS